MQRRQFITFLGGAAVGLPSVMQAQAPERVRIVGALLGIAESNPEGQLWLSAFRQGLMESGWIEGKNVQLKVRWPASDTNLMLRQAGELLDERCEVILTHASPATMALRQAAPAVSNIFVAVVDPIASGFIQSIAHPGGNSTGFTNFEPAMGGKWLELLKEIAPACINVAVMLNSNTFPGGFESPHVHAMQAGAISRRTSVSKRDFRNADEIESGFNSFAPGARC
jgi:putative ABC transport system substrate-binding protein